MLTAAVVIGLSPMRKQLSTQERRPQSNLTRSTACGFAALTGNFLALSRGVCQWRELLALGGAEVAAARAARNARRWGRSKRFIRVKFKLFSFLEKVRRHRRQPCTSRSTTSESG